MPGHPMPSRTTHRLLSALMAAALVPALVTLWFAAAISGPHQFFGEYSSEGGRHALLVTGLLFLACVAWAWFFVSYRQAAPATALGMLVTSAGALASLYLAYLEIGALRDGPPWHGRDNPATLVPWLVIAPLLLILVATTAALALRRPRLRPLAFVAAAALTLAGCWLVLRWIIQGGHALETMLLLASPLVLGLCVVAALWLDARERAARS